MTFYTKSAFIAWPAICVAERLENKPFQLENWSKIFFWFFHKIKANYFCALSHNFRFTRTTSNCHPTNSAMHHFFDHFGSLLLLVNYNGSPAKQFCIIFIGANWIKSPFLEQFWIKNNFKKKLIIKFIKIIYFNL